LELDEARGWLKKRDKLFVEGLVIPSSWDENGLTMGVSLHTYDQKQYQIQLNRLVKELLDLVQISNECFVQRPFSDVAIRASMGQYDPTLG
jgi:hypothetical protein